MSFWMRITEDNQCGMEDTDPEDLEFSLCLGREPMKQNMFEMIVPVVLQKLYFNDRGFFTVYYAPVREDGLSAIQACRPEIDKGFHVEIVMKSCHPRGFSIYARENVDYKETVALFRKVVEEYKVPKMKGWEEVTDEVRYV